MLRWGKQQTDEGCPTSAHHPPGLSLIKQLPLFFLPAESEEHWHSGTQLFLQMEEERGKSSVNTRASSRNQESNLDGQGEVEPTVFEFQHRLLRLRYPSPFPKCSCPYINFPLWGISHLWMCNLNIFLFLHELLLNLTTSLFITEAPEDLQVSSPDAAFTG